MFKRILIVRPSALGDVARTVPALAGLRAACPNATIDWLVRDDFVDVVASHPALNEVIEFPRRRFRKFGRSWTVTREVFRFLGNLRQRRYDTVYDLQGLGRSGMFTFATRAPRRIGFADAREAAWLAYNKRVKATASHTVDRMLEITAADGHPTIRDMRLYVSPDDQAWADQWIANQGLSPNAFLLIAPTAMWRSKQWPLASYDTVASRSDELNLGGSVVVGSPGDVQQTRQLFDRNHDRRFDLVGQTSVGKLMAIINRCGLIICNDSASLHIAVGLGKRCVSIFGPTDPALVGPYRYDQAVIRPDLTGDVHYRDLKNDQSIIAGITVEQVMDRAKTVLASEAPNTIH